MKVSACSGMNFSGTHSVHYGAAVKKPPIKAKTTYTMYEPGDKPELKRLSLAVGLTSLAIMSFLLALSGKVCNIAKV